MQISSVEEGGGIEEVISSLFLLQAGRRWQEEEWRSVHLYLFLYFGLFCRDLYVGLCLCLEDGWGVGDQSQGTLYRPHGLAGVGGWCPEPRRAQCPPVGSMEGGGRKFQRMPWKGQRHAVGYGFVERGQGLDQGQDV